MSWKKIKKIKTNSKMNQKKMLRIFLEERGIDFSIQSFSSKNKTGEKVWRTELNIQMENFEKKIFRGFSKNLKLSKEFAISKACGILGITMNQDKKSKLKIITTVNHTENLNKYCDQMGLRQPYYSVVPSKNSLGWYVTGFFNFNGHKISVTRKGIHIRDARQEISKYILDEIEHINNPEKIIIVKKVDSEDQPRQIFNRNGKFQYKKSSGRDQSPPREKKSSKQINQETDDFSDWSSVSSNRTEELSEPHYNSPVQIDENNLIFENIHLEVDKFLSELNLILDL